MSESISAADAVLIVRYLERSLSEADRSALERRLASEPALRRALVERHRERGAERAAPSSEALERAMAIGRRETIAPGRLPLRRVALAATVLVACGATIATLVSRSSRAPLASDPLRELAPLAFDAVVLDEPVRAPSGEAIALRWQSVPTAIGYAIILLDERGSIVGRAESETSRLALDDLGSDERARTRYWFVEAHLGDGSRVAAPATAISLSSAP